MKKLLIVLLFFTPGLLFSDGFQDAFLYQVNQHRREHNLKELIWSDNLEKMAKHYSCLCAESHIMSHDLLTGEEWRTKAKEFGIKTITCYELLVDAPVARPIAYNCVQSLINSPEHNAGLLYEYGHSFAVAYTHVDGNSYVAVYISGK